MSNLDLETFYDKKTYTLTYLLYDRGSNDAILIDPVLNYDNASSTISLESVNEVKEFILKNQLNLHYVLETHAHADHLSGAVELKKIFPKVKVGIGKGITLVQEVFKEIYHEPNWKTDGTQFDLLLNDGQEISAGTIKLKVISTPGHTPACVSFLVEDRLFTGDALFMPDYGTGRCDFPKGSAEDLYQSVHEKLYALPNETRYYTGHDYQPGGRDLKFESTIGESKKQNIQLKENTRKEEFVAFRTARDATLNAPLLLLQSIQVNINGGKLPSVENNGVSYLKIPVRSKE